MRAILIATDALMLPLALVGLIIVAAPAVVGVAIGIMANALTRRA